MISRLAICNKKLIFQLKKTIVFTDGFFISKLMAAALPATMTAATAAIFMTVLVVIAVEVWVD